MRLNVKANTFLVAALFVCALPAQGPDGKRAVLWQNPADIASRNLFYGPGGEEHQPRAPFTFVEEDMAGTNPKFVVRDAAGLKWKVKMGIEAKPETAASRIAWAVGYYTDDEYFVQDLQVSGMPAHLHRGQSQVGPNGLVHNVRLKRHGDKEKDTGDWKWRQDPFTGTRELNGLRVLMAVMNNWDLKDQNNHIYSDGDKDIYMVSDLGATFGATGRAPFGQGKSNLDQYSHSRFIRKTTPTTVDFTVPGRPAFIYIFNPKEFISRIRLEWIGRNIPREDAKWMGKLLATLSPAQIHDAFRAAGYSPREADAFAAVVARRITMLTDL